MDFFDIQKLEFATQCFENYYNFSNENKKVNLKLVFQSKKDVFAADSLQYDEGLRNPKFYIVNNKNPLQLSEMFFYIDEENIFKEILYRVSSDIGNNLSFYSLLSFIDKPEYLLNHLIELTTDIDTAELKNLNYPKVFLNYESLISDLELPFKFLIDESKQFEVVSLLVN